MGTSGVPDPLGLSGHTLSHFRVLEPLGAGGMGVVYRAEDLRLDRTVVLKFMHSDSAADEEATARFLREARSVATLDHVNVCTIYEVGESEQGHFFLAMGYYAGQTLKERLRETGALPLDVALDIAAQIARGLHCAHAAGIVHRDLKPANVMLTSDGTVKILDFGLAKARDQTLTASGVVLGTVAYMSPEQLLGEPVEARSDLYSLGVILYEMVTGEHPSRGDDLGERLTREVEARQALPPQPSVAASVRRLVERSLKRDPAQRYQTAAEMLNDLRDLRGRISGVAPSPGVQPRRRIPLGRRARMASVAGGLVAVAIGVAWTKLGPFRGASSSAASPSISLAVLPLKNYSSREQEYFADGMTDELTTTLAKIEGLRVIAHQSVLQFKDSRRTAPEIAKQLGVTYIVDGALRQDSSRVSLTVRVIDPVRNTPKWSKTFERAGGDVMRLQRDIALAIAGSIAVPLTSADQSRLTRAHVPPQAAFDLYWRGTKARYEANMNDKFADAASYYVDAIRIDSAYADAYAGLASIRMSTGDEPAARALAEKSLALDPTLAEGHVTRGMVRQYFDWDVSGAEQSFREAIKLSPGFPEAHHELGMTLLRVRRFDEALEEARQAAVRAPESMRFRSGVGEVYVFAGRYREAIDFANQLLADDSTFVNGNRIRGFAYEALGRWEDALRDWRTVLRVTGPDDGYARARIGYIYGRSGRQVQAMEVLDSLHARFEQKDATAEGDLAVNIATVYSGLRDREQTLAWLERARAARAFFVLYAAVDFTFEWLHEDPRFQTLLERVGLPRA